MKILYPSDLITIENPILYRRPNCHSFWTYVELEEEAEGQDEIIDYWFYTERCPDCEG